MFIFFAGDQGVDGVSSADAKLSSAWDNALSATRLGSTKKVAGAQAPTDTAAAAAAVLSKKRAQQRRQAKDDKAPKVLFCLTLTNPIRKTCIRIVEHTYPLPTRSVLFICLHLVEALNSIYIY